MPTPPDAMPVDYSVEPNKYTIPVTITTLTPFLPVAAAPPVTWSHYIINLPTWEQTLLEGVTFINRRQLFALLRSAYTLFLASNGGASDRRGSFDALIATGNTILIECSRRAQAGQTHVRSGQRDTVSSPSFDCCSTFGIFMSCRTDKRDSGYIAIVRAS
jgi:hypothetical protein